MSCFSSWVYIIYNKSLEISNFQIHPLHYFRKQCRNTLNVHAGAPSHKNMMALELIWPLSTKRFRTKRPPNQVFAMPACHNFPSHTPDCSKTTQIHKCHAQPRSQILTVASHINIHCHLRLNDANINFVSEFQWRVVTIFNITNIMNVYTTKICDTPKYKTVAILYRNILV